MRFQLSFGGRHGLFLWVTRDGVWFWARLFGRGPFWQRHRPAVVGETTSL